MSLLHPTCRTLHPLAKSRRLAVDVAVKQKQFQAHAYIYNIIIQVLIYNRKVYYIGLFFNPSLKKGP